MTHLLAILASMSAWIHKITPESSTVPYHILSTPVSTRVSLLRIPNSLPPPLTATLLWRIFCRHGPRWTHEKEVMLTILPYRPLTSLQHPDTIDYSEYTCVLPAGIPHREIHISLRSRTNSAWPLATQPSLIDFCRFSMLHKFYAMQSGQMLKHSRIITLCRGVICRGTRYHSGSQCSIWPAPRVS